MLKRFIIGVFFALLSVQCLFAQVEGQNNIRELVKTPAPPSPNAAALGKFGDIKVSLSTGIPDINVPIFTWADNLKELSINISLSYHAGGHKVEDMASNVGLGWALNGGGMISRTTRGIPDDGTGGYLNTSVLPSFTTNPIGFVNNPPPSPADGIHMGNYSEWDTIKYITERSVDGEFDIFNINAGNITAKFFIDKNGGVNFFTQTNLQVSYERSPSGNQPINKFRVTDERGIVYVFDVHETTNSESIDAVLGSQTMACISSFYLSKIVSADNTDTIFFDYSAGSTLMYEGGFAESCRQTIRNNTFLPPAFTYSYSHLSTVAPQRLSLIRFPDSTRVSMTYGFARADYDGDYGLTEIGISNSTMSWKYILSYDYFSTAYDPFANPMSDNDYTKRLKLLSVQQISGPDSLPPYVFEYNSQNLPPRHSRSQDHWGFYNGIANPHLVSGVATPPSPWIPQMTGADRSAVEQYTKASVLEKIIYPTGGNTQFTYHINSANTPLYNIGFGENSVSGLDENAVGTYVSLPFSNRIDDSVRFSVSITNNLPPPEMEPWDENCPVYLIVKSTDNTILDSVSFTYATAPTAYLTLPTNKTYQVKYESECMWWLEDFVVNVQYQYAIAPQDKNVGGLRVAKTVDSDSAGNKIVTEYSYLRTDGNSSGQLQNLPNYNYYVSTTYQAPIASIPFYHDFHYNRIATPSQTLAYFRGSPIIYTRVKVKKSSPSKNIGHSIHEFSEFSGPEVEDLYYPFLQKQSFEWSQSQSLRDSVFNSSNQLVKSVANEWEDFNYYQDSAKSRCMITGLVYHDYAETPAEYVYAAKSYNMYFGRTQLKKSTETLYANGDSMKVVKEYSYDPNRYYQITEKNSTSTGDTLEVRIYYPFNYSIETDDAISTVISKETWEKKSGTWYFTGAVVNGYDEFNSAFTKQAKVIATEINNPLNAATVGAFDPASLARHSSFKEQATYTKYDANGRCIEVRSVNSPVTSFIWSTERNYPVAEVTNADESDIAYTSFENGIQGKWSYSGATTNHPSAIMGSKGYSLSGGNITRSGLLTGKTYIVTYWKRDSAGTVTVNGGAGSSLVTRAGWSLCRHQITGTTSLTITGSAYIDELRLQPAGSLMTTRSLLPLAGVSSECSSAHQITYYEYDRFGRLRRIKDHNKNVRKVIDYQYKQSQNQ